VFSQRKNKEFFPQTHKGQTQQSCLTLHKDLLPLLPGRFDHLVAIERAGRAADGNYYNARKVNIKHLVDPIDDLFLAAQKIPGISSTGEWGIQQAYVNAKCLFY
jgi:hypothetical protein